MKSFKDYLKENVNDEGLNVFLKDHGLEDDWQSYKNKPKPIVAPPEEAKGWKLGPDEAMRDINHIISECIDKTTKVNNFGIEDIKFETINTEETSTGIKINMEAQGTAHARNKEHIKKQLERLMATAKPRLAEKGIHMEVLYNKIDTNDSVEETNFNEPAVGLIRKIDFRVVCTAIVSADKHKQPI